MKSCLLFWKKHPAAAAATALSIFCIPAFFISPAIDDWMTSRPIFQFDISLLLPKLFWRPFENLIRLAVGRNTQLHSFLFHLLAVSGHIGSAAVLYRILLAAQKQTGPALAATVLFCIFPAGASAVWSLDSAIQTWSTFFGLVSLRALQRHSVLRGGIFFFLSACASVLWKESGISWFVAAPLFAAALSESPPCFFSSANRKKLLLLGIGLCGAALYLAVRRALTPPDFVAAEAGRYDVHLSPFLWLKNTAMLLGVSCSTVDTVSLFGPQNSAAAIISFAGGAPLFLWAFGRAALRLRSASFWTGALAVGALIAPHAVLGHVSEMYAHPVTAGIAIWLIGVLRIKPEKASRAPWFFILALVTCLAVSAHKWTRMYRTGLRAKNVAAQILKHYGGPDAVPRKACTLITADNRPPGYSVFYAGAPSASNWGRSVWAETKWRRPVDIVSIQTPEACPPDIVEIWRIDASGSFSVLGRR